MSYETKRFRRGGGNLRGNTLPGESVPPIDRRLKIGNEILAVNALGLAAVRKINGLSTEEARVRYALSPDNPYRLCTPVIAFRLNTPKGRKTFVGQIIVIKRADQAGFDPDKVCTEIHYGMPVEQSSAAFIGSDDKYRTGVTMDANPIIYKCKERISTLHPDITQLYKDAAANVPLQPGMEQLAYAQLGNISDVIEEMMRAVDENGIC